MEAKLLAEIAKSLEELAKPHKTFVPDIDLRLVGNEFLYVACYQGKKYLTGKGRTVLEALADFDNCFI